MRLTIRICLLLASLSSSAIACTFDTDCQSGFRCYRSSGGIFGVCAGEVQPSSRKIVFEDRNRNSAIACSFDVDCGAGTICVKGLRDAHGICRLAPN